MKYEIQITSEAQADLKQIAEYSWDQYGGEHMESYMNSIRNTIEKLTEFPSAMGVTRDQFMLGLRSIPHQSQYHIFYIVENEMILIIRVLHQKRDWESLFR